jgi:hypothetical protein
VKEPKSFPLPRILRQRSFRLLWIGEGISILGDQFYFIALPWLVFKMNGDSLAVGCVLAAATIPQALFWKFHHPRHSPAQPFCRPDPGGCSDYSAGWLERLFNCGGRPTTRFDGIGYAFGFDALTFLVSILTLWMIRLPPPKAKIKNRKSPF